MKRRSRLWGPAGVAGLIVLGSSATPAPADGETGTMRAHRDDGATGYTCDIGGGEFGISHFSDPSILAPLSAPAKVAGWDFQTFCVEGGDAYLPQDADIDWVVDDRVNGVTPIAPQTAYLYTQFWNGTLTGYDYTLGSPREASARDLQEAIWYFQGQWQGPVDASAQAFVDAADAAVAGSWGDTIGDVRALTTSTRDGVLAQDVLVIVKGREPGLRLTKTADPEVAAPFQPVTYSYRVENTGSVDLQDVIVTDDNGTPNDASDDFQLGPVSIAAGGTHTFSTTVIPPFDLCATINGVPDTYAGTLETVILPGGDVRVTYVQSETATNDNRYGTGATAATGWPRGHKFGNLTGSDKCEFRFRDSTGAVVLDFFADYISGATSATFPSGTVSYPSRYGTLGCTGGDGSVVTGSASDVLSVHTSLSDCLNLPQFQALDLVNSPPETAPYSGVSTPAGWDYKDSYTVVVSAAAFGADGFGSVEIPSQHNSPPKAGKTNSLAPVPCDTTVTNTAVVTATAVGSGATVTATGTASVFIDAGSDGGGASDVSATITKFDKHKVTVALENDGTAPATIGSLTLEWPASNKRLRRIKKGGAVLFDTPSPPTSVTVATWKGKLADRQIAAGATLVLTFEFEGNASTTGSDYHLRVDFGAGPVVLLP